MLAPNFDIETKIGGLVAGIDEAGRGPLAGPVVAASVILEGQIISGINDSKKLSNKKREALFEKIISLYPYGIGVANVEEIENLNILGATKLAMQRALDNLTSNYTSWKLRVGRCKELCVPNVHERPSNEPNLDLSEVYEAIIVDGNINPFPHLNSYAIVKGDQLSLTIAASSIVAKVHRDKIMDTLHATYPAFGWNQNKGYGTKSHTKAILEYGPTEHHRLSFLSKLYSK